MNCQLKHDLKTEERVASDMKKGRMDQYLKLYLTPQTEGFIPDREYMLALAELVPHVRLAGSKKCTIW
jgi:hypothetical protein